MPTEAWYQQIHARMLAGDPVASSDLAEAAIDPLFAALRTKHPNLQGENLLEDAVTDAFMSYAKDPSQYDPTRRGLLGYLLMSAEGDLLNALAKQKRRSSREASLEVVEVGRVVRNVFSSDEDPARRIDAERLQHQLDQAITDPVDRELLQLLMNGERDTEAFARVLGLLDLTPEDQRREVKRHKDRIKKRLGRLGGSLRVE